MLKVIRTTLTAAAATVVLASLVAPALADDTQWQKDHPRREQVNSRLNNQNQRIKQERKEGEITKAQAQKLHSEDHAIRQEERTMASTNGGHLTKAEQKSLNQQENQVSKQIGK
jgi:septal ring factor EnvC (AmiA/AmiB activator)